MYFQSLTSSEAQGAELRFVKDRSTDSISDEKRKKSDRKGAGPHFRKGSWREGDEGGDMRKRPLHLSVLEHVIMRDNFFAWAMWLALLG
jgi:hypothetical protein